VVYNIKIDLREDEMVLIGLISFRIRFLYNLRYNFKFHGVSASSCVAARLSASQEGLSSSSQLHCYLVS
jgi:hypothetical protein